MNYPLPYKYRSHYSSVPEVEVLELGHVDEGAVDVDDGVVGDVQRGELAQRVEGVPRLQREGGNSMDNI